MSEEQQREVVDLKNERGEIRQYETVASRLARFREKFPNYTLRTEVFKDDGDSVAIKATIGFYATDGAFCVLAEGHSEEFRGSSSINSTACMENAETSAWGRALAAFGFGSPTGIASAEEVDKAKRREKELSDVAPGVLVLLQNAAKQGVKALVKEWEGLKRIDRDACAPYMAKLKREAQQVDRGEKKEPKPSSDDVD